MSVRFVFYMALFRTSGEMSGLVSASQPPLSTPSLARRKAVSVSRLSCLITRLYAMSSEQTEHTSDTGRQSLSRN